MESPALALGTAQATATVAAFGIADRGRERTNLAVPASPTGPACLGG